MDEFKSSQHEPPSEFRGAGSSAGMTRAGRGRQRRRGPVLGTADGREFCLDLETLLATRLLVQAASGGGKSYALRRLLEQTCGKVQQIILDPEGELVTLADKFPYLVLGADSGDAPLTPESADRLAEALYRSGHSAILCLDGFEIEAMQRFVAGFVMGLMRQPKEHWHHCLIAFDETQIFAPQHDTAFSKKPMLDLAARARKRGMCPVVATQRISQLHKGLAAHMDNKLVGLTTLDNDVERAADVLGMKPARAAEVLRKLDRGEFLAYGPALTYDVTKVKVGPVQTRHGALSRFTGKAPKKTIRRDALLASIRDMAVQPDSSDSDCSDARASIAVMRQWVIAPLVDRDHRRGALAARCRELSLAPHEVMRWVASFRKRRAVADLAPRRLRQSMLDDLDRLRPLVQAAPLNARAVPVAQASLDPAGTTRWSRAPGINTFTASRNNV